MREGNEHFEQNKILVGNVSTIVLPNHSRVLEELVEKFGDERSTRSDEEDGVRVLGRERYDESEK